MDGDKIRNLIEYLKLDYDWSYKQYSYFIKSINRAKKYRINMNMMLYYENQIMYYSGSLGLIEEMLLKITEEDIDDFNGNRIKGIFDFIHSIQDKYNEK